MMRNIHIIYAHPRGDSLNHTILETAVKHFQLSSHIHISDLYQMYMEKHPLTKPFGMQKSEDDLVKIKKEQQHIATSDLTILQFPMYWFSVPGLMKNYIDQVLESGFAYPGTFTSSPLHDGRKILFSVTTQSSHEAFTEEGNNGDIKNILFHLATAFRFVGYDILKPFVIFAANNMSEKIFSEYNDTYIHYLKHIHSSENIWLHA